MSYYQQLLDRQGIKLNEEAENNRREILPINYSPRRKSVFDKHGRRICCVCFTAKDADQYTTKRSSVDGKDPRCKSCKAELTKKHWVISKAVQNA